MIKGCAKRVVVVRDIDSNFFEEAFFIVKQGSAHAKTGENDFINEANRIVRYDLPALNLAGTAALQKSKKRSTPRAKSVLRDVLMFVFGFGISAVMCTFIYYSGIPL